MPLCFPLPPLLHSLTPPAPHYNNSTTHPPHLDFSLGLYLDGNSTSVPSPSSKPPSGGAHFIWYGSDDRVSECLTPLASSRYLTLIYFLNNVPAALSNVTKELAFNNTPMDVYYLGSWVAWFQLFFSLAFLPVTNLKPFGGIAWKSIPTQMLHGLKCFAGINSVTEPNAPDGFGPDNCSFNYIATSAYIVINCAFPCLWL